MHLTFNRKFRARIKDTICTFLSVEFDEKKLMHCKVPLFILDSNYVFGFVFQLDFSQLFICKFIYYWFLNKIYSD